MTSSFCKLTAKDGLAGCDTYAWLYLSSCNLKPCSNSVTLWVKIHQNITTQAYGVVQCPSSIWRGGCKPQTTLLPHRPPWPWRPTSHTHTARLGSPHPKAVCLFDCTLLGHPTQPHSSPAVADAPTHRQCRAATLQAGAPPAAHCVQLTIIVHTQASWLKPTTKLGACCPTESKHIQYLLIAGQQSLLAQGLISRPHKTPKISGAYFDAHTSFPSRCTRVRRQLTIRDEVCCGSAYHPAVFQAATSCSHPTHMHPHMHLHMPSTKHMIDCTHINKTHLLSMNMATHTGAITLYQPCGTKHTSLL